MDLWKGGKSVVVITGATGVLGHAFSLQIARLVPSGSHLVLSSRSSENLCNLKDAILRINQDVQVSTLVWDLNNPDFRQYEDELQSATNSLRNFAGQPIRLRSVNSFHSAVLIHCAAEIGDYSKTVQQIGADLDPLKNILNVNVVSLLAVSTAFLNIFGGGKAAKYKAIVNLTAPCAENAYASFGHDAISKAAKKMALDVLSKERPDVKVLHFNPVAVESPAFYAIRDHSHDVEVKAAFQSISKHHKTYTAEHVAAVLCDILNDFLFESGAVIGTNDVPIANGHRPVIANGI
ncbi:short chain dehydrogenase domain-containing protein [Ditylenchus destructor]|nr:short chain dehydrogenase domain-containing protein [Ditylenchus destructor]